MNTACKASGTVDAGWSHRDAWKCALALIACFLFLWGFWWYGGWVWYRSDSSFCAWIVRYYTQIWMTIQGILWLLIGYRLSKATSLRNFFSNVGLGQRPTFIGLFIAWALIGMECVQARLTFGHWTYTCPSQPLAVRLLPGLSALYEEIIVRGFMYRAFRRSYGVFPSTLSILALSELLHIFVFRSLGDVIVFTITSILLCQVRERSLSLWNCVLGHAVWNAVAVGDWLVCGAEMAIYLMFCRPLNKANSVRQNALG